MASNPQIAQGTLNRLRGSVVVPAFPSLQVTAPFLGKQGISLSFQGEAAEQIPTMTGTVVSDLPYQMATISIALLKTQSLSSVWEAQRQSQSAIGSVTVTPDTSAHPTYTIENCSIGSVRELSFSGDDAGYVVTVNGYYQINNDNWNLA